MEYMRRLSPMNVARLMTASLMRSGDKNLTTASMGDEGAFWSLLALPSRSASIHHTIAGA